MPLEEGEGVSESQVAFYNVAGHNHDGVNSTKIDFGAYNILDVIDMDQLRDIIMGTVNNSTLSPNALQVGFSEGTVRIDGAAPSTVTNLTATSAASTTSDGNIFINVSWAGTANSSVNKYVVELHKSETGSNGTYTITRSHETTALSHKFERIDNNTGDGGNIYYKVVVYAVSSVGVYSVPATSSAIAPAVNSTAPANPTFNDSYAIFDEGVKPSFKGMFVYLDDNTEFDVKELRGRYEYQVSTSKTSFDTSANLKASGKSKSTYFTINNLDVRSSAGGSKIDYYLRIRAINSSGTASSWVYYKNAADGGSSGAGTTTASAASAINVLEIDAGVDVQANTITANQIAADTITATQIAGHTITGDQLDSVEIEVSRHIQSPDFATGTDGWKIEGSGNAEFSEATVRGVIYANTGRIGGTNGWTIASNVIQSIPSAANAVHLNSGGGSIPYLRMGAKTGHDNANNGVWLDPTNGLVLGSGTTGAWIKPDGKLYLGGTSGSALAWDGSTLTIDGGGSFSGDISAASGTFTGNLSGGTIDIGGSDTSSFHVNSSGDMWLGAAALADAPFRVSSAGQLDVGDDDSSSWHVDKDGNMWWGSSSTYSGATIKISNTGVVDFDSGTFKGTVDAATLSGAITSTATITGGAFSTGPSGAFSVTSGGAVTASDMTITGGSMTLGNIVIDSTSFSAGAGSGSASPFYVASDGLMSFGVNAGTQLRIDPDGKNFIWDGTVLEFADSPTSSTVHGYIQADKEEITLFLTQADFEGITMGSGSENYIGVFQKWAHNTNPTNTDDYGIVLNATQDGEDVILLNADQGIRITDNLPTSGERAGKLYASNGQLFWNDIRLDTSGGGVDSIIAGSNVQVSSATGDVTVSATNTTYTAGTLLDLSGTQFNVDLSELTASTTNGHADYIVCLDSGTTPYKVQRDQIQLSGFNNNLGWTSNVGDITNVSVGTGLGGGGSSGSVTISLALHNITESSSSSNADHILCMNDSNATYWIEPEDIDISRFNNNAGYAGDTTYSAGNGISLSGTTFSLSNTPVITGAIKLGSGSTSAPAYSFSATGADVAGMSHVSIFGVHATYLASNGKHFGVYSNGTFNMTDPGTGSGNTLYYDGGNVKRSSSQEILKENITAISSSAALARIKALRPVEYNMKPELFDGDEAEWQVYHKKRGFIAEEVSAVDHWMAQHWWLDPTDAKRLRPSPKSYSETEDTDPSNYDMADTAPIDWNDRAVITDAVAAIQELSTKLDAAEARLAALEA